MLLSACGTVKQGEAPSGKPSAGPGTEFALALGESIGIAGTQLIVTFSKVPEDSRCPMNARCVWEGNAKIALEVRVSPSSPGSAVELNTSTRFATTQNVSGFTVELRRLEPMPMAGAQTTGYIATLSIGAAP